MHMADPLRQTYLPLAKREIGEIEAVWSVTDMRSPTEIETEHLDMIAPVPIRQENFSTIYSKAINDRQSTCQSPECSGVSQES